MFEKTRQAKWRLLLTLNGTSKKLNEKKELNILLASRFDQISDNYSL